ncbi:MAG: hypothetical protein WCJ37_15670 [Syntrophus sp. (in: bacteria)]
MPKKIYTIEIAKDVFILVYFVTEKGAVGRFVVKLNIIIGDVTFELARYDGGLHEPHLDIIKPDGSKYRTVDYSALENAQAVNVAIQDFSNNWELYLERWKKWVGKRK